MNTLPDNFTKRLSDILPENKLSAVLSHFSQTKPTLFRINTLKTNIISAIDQLKELGLNPKPINHFDNAFIINETERSLLTNSDPFNNGHIYIQSLESMLPPLILNPKPGEEILDLTAAPGSKTTQIAALMQNQGRIGAVEKVKARYFKLKNNLQLQDAKIVDTYLKDGALIGKLCPERFDRVLLDAPCSSEGRFNTNEPASYKYWSEKKIKEMSRKQWPLMVSAWHALKPNGLLVYSTCTFAPEENEAIINKLIKKFGEQVQLQPISLAFDNIQPGLTSWQGKTFDASLKQCIRILPNEMMGGFFICAIIKLASTHA